MGQERNQMTSGGARGSQQAGFTLLEAVLAIGLLSVVLSQVLGVQASSAAVTQNARDTMRASWALRQASAQLEYVLDVYGAKGLAPEGRFTWPADQNFVVSWAAKEAPVPASRFLTSAMKLGKAMGAGGVPEEEGAEQSGADSTKGMGEFTQMLDQMVPKEMYWAVKFQVEYRQGSSQKTLDGSFLVVDTKVLAEKMGALAPNLPNMDGGPGAGPGGGPGTGPGGAGAGPGGAAGSGTGGMPR